MSKKQEQRIAVKGDQLANLIASVAEGDYRIPQFQREFVWPKGKIRELFDSIYREFPIGSFFLWRAGREHNGLFRHTVAFDVPPVDEHDSVSFILDGQQRITSLYVALMGLTVRQNGSATDYSRICFDLKEEKFVDRAPDNKRYVSVSDIWGQDSLMLSHELDKEYLPAFQKCWRTLQTYPISIVEVRDKDLADVCKIFQRINQSGKRLDRFDLISAMTFRLDFDLREKFRDDVTAPLAAKNFGQISPAIVTQLLALAKDGQCTERHEFGLTSEDIQGRWKPAVDAILLAADTLRKNMGVANSDYLPYDAILTLLAYYFLKSGKRSPSSEHLVWLNRWFWRSAFGQRYSAGGPTRMGQDAALLDKLIGGGTKPFELPLNLSVPDLVKVRMPQTRSAVRNAFLCLLAIRDPKHLVNNSSLDLVGGSVSGFTESEKHHIFPKAFLRDHGPTGADIHSLPNFCFLPSELNKRINDSKPSEYFPALRKENPKFEVAAATHLLPKSTSECITNDDYLEFLEVRGQLILDEVRRLCGEVTTPREGEQQGAVHDLERRLRDVIHGVLSAKAGDKYWKQCVPQDVRENAEKRIQQAIMKYPDMRREDVSAPRSRLDYVNVMDYLTIIQNGANWPAFEAIFRKKHELERYLSGFSEYRNALMHTREMTELVETNGKAALIWFASILPGEETPEPEETD